MAMNKQDYQYVRNTLPSADSSILDNSLRVGSAITNLLPELKDNQVIGMWNDNSIKYNQWCYVDGGETVSTVSTGVLKIALKVQANKNYVLQILGTTNTLSFSDNIKLLNQEKTTRTPQIVGNYLFFNPGNYNEIHLSIYGLSFGYSLLKNANSDKELRYFKGLPGKVFLFESDLPWVVDLKGVVASLNPSNISSFIDEKDTSKPSEARLVDAYVNEEIDSIFSVTPVFEVHAEDPIYLYIKGPEVNTAKYRKWANSLGEHEHVKLLVFRDYLCENEKHYRSKNGTPFIVKKRRTMIRSINNTENDSPDPYKTKAIIKRIYSPDFDVDSGYVTFTTERLDDANTKDNGTEDQQEIKQAKLGHISLLGGNKLYAKINGIQKDEMYKYTSVCFAWGRLTIDGEWKILSNFTDPLIIERKQHVIKNGKLTVEINGDFSIENSSKYYPHKHVLFQNK